MKMTTKKLAGEEEETELGGEEGEGGEGDELPQEEEQADQNLQTPLRETIHVSRESSQNSLLTGLPIQVCRATQPNGPGGAPGKVPPTPRTRAQLTLKRQGFILPQRFTSVSYAGQNFVLEFYLLYVYFVQKSNKEKRNRIHQFDLHTFIQKLQATE